MKGIIPEVTEIIVMTGKELADKIKGYTASISDDRMVWYFEYKGPFRITCGRGHVPGALYGVEVYDAQTGNRLFWWIPPHTYEKAMRHPETVRVERMVWCIDSWVPTASMTECALRPSVSSFFIFFSSYARLYIQTK